MTRLDGSHQPEWGSTRLREETDRAVRDLDRRITATESAATSASGRIKGIEARKLRGVEAWFNFEESLSDLSNNGNTLTHSASQARYMKVDGKWGAQSIAGVGYYQNTSPSAGVKIVGDMTLHALVHHCGSIKAASNDGAIAGCYAGPTGGNEGQWLLYHDQSSDFRTAYYAWDGSAAINYVFQTIWVPRWVLYSMVRRGDQVTLYVNGNKCAGPSTSAGTPSSSGTVHLVAGWELDALFGSIVVQSHPESAGSIMNIARQVGVT